MEKNMEGCPCINFCEISSQACNWEDLEYCQPNFHFIKDVSCSICGSKLTCYKINDSTRACKECLKSFIFNRMAQMAGIDFNLMEKIAKRL